MERRDFVKKAILTSFATTLGTKIVFGNSLPKEYTPIGLQNLGLFKLFVNLKKLIISCLTTNHLTIEKGRRARLTNMERYEFEN